MIRVFNIPALTWTLTAVLLLGGAYNLAQAVRARHLTDRINNTLHALMHTLMAAMLWNLAPATTLAQITLLAGAALWFTLQAVARPQFKLLCNGTPGKLKCAYHSLTMAAAATMITLMTTHTTPTPEARTAGPTNPTAGTAAMADMPGMPGMHAAHHMTTTAAGPTLIPSHTPALLLTLTFTAAAATFLTLLLRHRRKSTTHQGTHQKTTRTDHALETLSATTMALMFATMTA